MEQRKQNMYKYLSHLTQRNYMVNFTNAIKLCRLSWKSTYYKQTHFSCDQQKHELYSMSLWNKHYAAS